MKRLGAVLRVLEPEPALACSGPGRGGPGSDQSDVVYHVITIVIKRQAIL
jgi:hypothetical protein